MKEKKKQVLKVRNLKTNEIVREVEVTGKSQNQIERVMSGMLRNMSDDYYVDDSDSSP